MSKISVKEGDICILDESVEYSCNPKKPYNVLVLWHGVNNQPLVTRLGEYKPFWTTYSQLTTVLGNIVLNQITEAAQKHLDEKETNFLILFTEKGE